MFVEKVYKFGKLGVPAYCLSFMPSSLAISWLVFKWETLPLDRSPPTLGYLFIRFQVARGSTVPLDSGMILPLSGSSRRDQYLGDSDNAVNISHSVE